MGIVLTIIDSNRSIHAHTETTIVEAAVGALSADPETIEELECAIARFRAESLALGIFNRFEPGIEESPDSAGICIIDLRARLVACRCPIISLVRQGDIAYCDDRRDVGPWIRFHLSKKWALTRQVEQWQTLSASRRATISNAPQIDFRSVIMGEPLLEFILRRCRSVDKPTIHAAAKIHADWLLTPLNELDERPPRCWLLQGREHIDRDLECRDQQWTIQGRCPPPISRESEAYRFGGCGTHEIILYFDLVRHLIVSCLDLRANDVVNDGNVSVENLGKVRDTWLTSAQLRLHGKSPQQVIDDERQRIPQAIPVPDVHSVSGQAIDGIIPFPPKPRFWHLDATHFESCFAFSFCETPEQWEDECRDWAEFSRRFENDCVSR